MNDGSEMETLRSLENVNWGFTDENGEFVVLPKMPLIRAGYRKPPFDVKMQDGSLRHVEEQSVNDTVVQQYPPIEGAIPGYTSTGGVEGAGGFAVNAQGRIKVNRKIKVYTSTKLRHAPIIRNEISKWPEIEVTSRWPFSHVDGDEPLWPEDCASHGSIFWTRDEEDVRKCDAVLVFGDEDDVLRGALVEAGMAIGFGKRVIVVGTNPAYGTWQFHPNVYRVKDMQTARSLLSLLASDLAA